MKRYVAFLRIAVTLFVVAISLGICGPVAAAANTFYVGPNGNDGNDGLSPGSPWQTVARVNGTQFAPGDTILFQRGGEWHESLIAPSSGAAGNPITFADYGSGAKPKFWGSVVLDNSQFQPVSNGIYIYPLNGPAYSVLANHGFFNYSYGQPAGYVDHSWSTFGGVLAINSPDSDPRYDGRVYTAVQRDDVVYSNYQSHLVFRNLVTDESARYDDNGGYGFRIMGSTDVVVTGCEAYHAGKHHFGVINSTSVVSSNLTAAYAAPGQGAGGASAFVSYGDTSTGLYGQTSEWHNVSASNLDDPQDSTVYEAFVTHGPAIGSLLVDHLQSAGADVSFSNSDNPSATVKVTGGLIQNARMELDGSGILVDGMELSGANATIDMTGDNMVLQNMLIHGTNMGYQWYQTAVLSRGVNNTLRFSTIVMDPNAGTNTCIALTNVNGGFQVYGNVLLAPFRTIALWGQGLSFQTISQSSFNFYGPGATVAQVNSAYAWVDTYLPQWQTEGFDAGSRQGDPGFVDAGNGNYRPAAGSPLIDAALLPGSLVAAVPVDFDGNPRLQGAAFDMGAFEGVAGIVQPVPTTTTISLNNGVLSAQVVATSGVPTGTVSFLDGSTVVGTGTLTNGSTNQPVSLDSTQAHTITAAYSGSASFQASTSQPLSVAAVPPPAAVIPPPAPVPPAPQPVAPVPAPVAPAPAPVAPAPVSPAPAPTFPLGLTWPANGQTISGQVYVNGVIAVTLDAAGSSLLVDGQFVGAHLSNGPYFYFLDTTQLSPGSHTLQIWAHDINNDTLLSNLVTVNVAN